MIHLYGLVERDAEIRAGLTVIREGNLACVGAPCADAEPACDLASLADHDAVVAELMERGPVVPFRYGTVLSDERQARHLLVRGAAHFEAMLESLRGRVELAVRAVADPDDQPGSTSPPSGRLYLASLAGGSAAATLAGLHRSLATGAAASACSIDAGGFMRSAYLVGTGDVDSFRALVSRAVGERPAVHDVSLTGPWAPYSFVSDSDTAWAEAVHG